MQKKLKEDKVFETTTTLHFYLGGYTVGKNEYNFDVYEWKEIEQLDGGKFSLWKNHGETPTAMEVAGYLSTHTHNIYNAIPKPDTTALREKRWRAKSDRVEVLSADMAEELDEINLKVKRVVVMENYR